MKKFNCFTFVVLSVISTVSVARADFAGQHGVNINDTTNYTDNVALFQLFNSYFGENLVSSSNDLYNKYGVDPNTSWTTNGSSIVGAFKVAAMGHTMSVFDKNGNNLGALFNVSGTENIGNGGITDLGGSSVSVGSNTDVNFGLNASWQGDSMYNWSSSVGINSDELIHMIGLDITDLYNAKNGTDFESVFMLCWEDLTTGLADWDYQDFVAIVTNVRPSDSTATPEPATLLLFGCGMVGLGIYRRRKSNF
jgi:hypothetical protein